MRQKRELLHGHAASVFEEVWRARYQGAARYWESGVEFDLVAPDPDDADGLLVAEIKWRRVSAAERRLLLDGLAKRWNQSMIAARRPRVRFELLDASLLPALARPATGA